LKKKKIQFRPIILITSMLLFLKKKIENDPIKLIKLIGLLKIHHIEFHLIKINFENKIYQLFFKRTFALKRVNYH